MVNGEHTFYLILETESAEKARDYMAPFSQMGTVEVWPPNSCEIVVSRGHC